MKNLTFKEIDLLYDTCFDVLINDSPVVYEVTGESDVGDFSICIQGIPQVYVVRAIEFDDEGIFDSYKKAYAFLWNNYSVFLENCTQEFKKPCEEVTEGLEDEDELERVEIAWKKSKNQHFSVAEPPSDASLVCSYEISTSMFTDDEEVVFFRRTETRDELWISDFDSQKEGCVFAVQKQHDEHTACLNLLKKLFGHSWSGSPTKFLKPGIATEVDFDSILGKIKNEFDKNIEEAQKNKTEIVEVAKELKLYTRPEGSNPEYWLATCPGNNHSLLLNAPRNEFWCGYCNRKGGIKELRAFAKERAKK